MKRHVSAFILIMTLLITSLSPVAANTPFTSAPQYRGMAGAAQMAQELQFNDINNHWGAPAILEIAGLGLLRGTGNNRFSPDQSLSYGDALTILLKARGLDEALREQRAAQAPVNVAGVNLSNDADAARQAVVTLAQQQGILTAAEADTINQLTPAEADALERSVNDQVQPYVMSELTSPELTELENALRQQLTTRTAWGRPASRQQVSVWLARTINLEPVAPGMTPELNRFTDASAIDQANRPFIEAVLQAGYLSGTSPTTFAPDASMTRAQMAAVMHKAIPAWIDFQGITRQTGHVEEITPITTGTGAGDVTRQISVKNHNGTAALIHATPQADLLVLRNTTYTLSSQVYVGDDVRWYHNPDGTARLMVLASGTSQAEAATPLTGFLENIDPGTNMLKIRDFNGLEHQLTARSGLPVTINGQPSSLQGLPYGIEITAARARSSVTGATEITRIDAFLEEDPALHGYIPPESRFKVGDVLSYDGNSVEITAMPSGNRETYQITSLTRIEREGRMAQPFEIKNGDRVILLFDDIYSPEIATLRVEDAERHITDLIRGTIDSVDLRAGEVILKDITRMENNRWVPHGDQLVRYKAENNQLYSGAQALTLQQLSRMTGSQVYAAAEQSYGVPRIAKLQLQNGSTQIYDTRIDRLEFATEQLQADYNSFAFHAGTIVVHNNRLVDRLNLAEQQSIYMLASLSGSGREAGLITILDQDTLEPRPGGTRLMLYLARLQDIYDYQVDMGRLGYQLDYLQLANYRWQPLRTARRASFSEDTLIYDSDLQLAIDPQVFLSTRFIDPQDIEDAELRKRIENRFYYDKTAYFLVRETTFGSETLQEVLAINLAPYSVYEDGNIQTEHSAMGTISGIDTAAGTFTMTGLRTWNALNGRWESTAGTETLAANKAVILLNDQPLTSEEIWRIRSGARAFVIKNKTSSTADTAYVVVIEQ
ncbi:S-layer homology domain-containing protein [Anoxynatronum buryatiense]|uniref:S-layer homology domain-containing protein n=1 Tax=Anoxynatronum buryatiense TaxID=489973 RepID=A0AA45WX10_9CLOT|nr:S-layer homology domain-containing protein [Anoxynatronum buryatiense]SMP56599.1 S-layer homology domain-containing protein [Anoxynatronum buryatiense]